MPYKLIKFATNNNIKANISKEKRILTFWGDGMRTSPYNQSRYHLGQLAMACTLSQLMRNGHHVNALLTADSFPRRSQQISQMLYKKRQNDLTKWLKQVCNDNLIVVDVSERYNEIANQSNEIRHFWNDCHVFLRNFTNECNNILNRNLTAKNQLITYLESCRWVDSNWSNAFDKAPKDLMTYLNDIFNNMVYDDFDDDLAALLFVILSKKPEWLQTEWIMECGVVFSSDYEQDYILEADKNLYWGRLFRFLSKRENSNGNNITSFPHLLSYKSLPNIKTTGPMCGSDQDKSIFLNDDHINNIDKLQKASIDFLQTTAKRISYCAASQQDYPHLKSLSKLKNKDSIKNAIIESISYFKEFWPSSSHKPIKIDNWFCYKYLSESLLDDPHTVSWRNGISPAISTNLSTNFWNYLKLTNRLVGKLLSNTKNRNIALAAKAVEKIISNTEYLDLILYMTQKRYRDHGIHEIHVALLSHLLANSLCPSATLAKPIKVSEKMADKLKVNVEDFNSGLIFSALVHDHGYPLLQVAMLISRLYTMKFDAKNKSKPLNDSKENNLALALENFIDGFCSKWYKRLLTNIKKNKRNDYLLMENWEPKQRALAAHLFDKSESDLKGYPTHGIFGAINFSELMCDLTRSDIDFPKKLLLYKMLKAIAVHDAPDHIVRFDDDIYSYLLIICDEIQEWSRKIYWDGKDHIESYMIKLTNMVEIEKNSGIYQLPDDLCIRFEHRGVDATSVPWEYQIFRESKIQNFSRLKGAKTSGLFPRTLYFDIGIGKERVIY